MKEKATRHNPEFLKYVYQLTDGMALMEALERSLVEIDGIDLARFESIGLKTYEEGKWTIHRILQHLIDWERIWCFRAVIFARAEGTIPDAHDQEIMARNSNADELSIRDLVKEMRIVRESTMMLFKSFNKRILETNCKFFEYEMPLFSIGLSIVAHQIHHLEVIRERYFPLVS